VADSVQFLDAKPNGQPAVRQDAPDRPVPVPSRAVGGTRPIDNESMPPF